MSVDSIVNLRNDIIFKVVFGYEKNEKILISLLNEILGLKDNDKISSLTFLNTFNIKEYLKDKITSLDVKVVDGNGKIYNVEMQVAPDQDYLKRIIYYHDKLYTSQLKDSEPYQILSKAISISILNFNLLKDETDFHNTYRYLNIKSKNELTDLKEVHFIELPKFEKKELKDLSSKFEKWIFALKYGEIYANDIDDIPEILKNEEEITMALREMLKAGNDDEIREILEMREKARHDEASKLLNAKLEGEQIGIIKGEQIGILKGKLASARQRLKNLLNRRFGSISNDISNKIDLYDDVEKLEKSIDSIFDFNSPEDVLEIMN